MTWVLLLLAGLLVILAITAATGYFVAQEFAYMAVDRSRLAARAETGDPAARRALSVTRRTSFMLSGAQLGITVTGLLVGYVAEPLVGGALGDALGGVGVPTAVGIGVGTVLALAFSTLVQMLFGELFPKNLAIAKPEPLALWLARSTTVYLAVFGWLIKIFDAASNALLRLIRIEPVHDVEHSATAKDLERIVADSRASGDLPSDLSVLLDRVLDFPRQDVEHAMIPRSRVDVVTLDTSLGELRTLMASGHSRYPVLDDDADPAGVVHLTDLLSSRDPDDASVESIMRQALVVPATMSLPDVLADLDRTRNQLACVVDEYGGFDGIITLEDIAEELVGEIADEHDEPETGWLRPIDPGDRWEADGDVHVDEIVRAIGRALPDGDFETIAGLAISTHGSLPEVGQVIVVQLPAHAGELALDEPLEDPTLEIEVVEIERHVPSLVRLTLTEAVYAPTDDEQSAGADRDGDDR